VHEQSEDFGGSAMDTWMLNAAVGVFLLLATTALFFFVVTRGALLMRALSPDSSTAKSHVYPIYSNMGLIKMVDFQPIISAILLFQYHHLVSKIIAGLKQSDLKNKKVLITSCAFGNVISRVVSADPTVFPVFLNYRQPVLQKPGQCGFFRWA
jgi:hypothetical protein